MASAIQVASANTVFLGCVGTGQEYDNLFSRDHCTTAPLRSFVNMALYSRHPRFTIALLVLIFISVLLFANSEPDDPPFSPVGFTRGGALVESLRVEESRYQRMLDQRQDLIRKWGPTPDKIDP